MEITFRDFRGGDREAKGPICSKSPMRRLAREREVGQEKPENDKGPNAVPRSNNGPNGDKTNNGRKATEPQIRAIYAIGKERGYEMKELLSGYGVEESSDLSIAQASKLIDALKNNGKE